MSDSFGICFQPRFRQCLHATSPQQRRRWKLQAASPERQITNDSTKGYVNIGPQHQFSKVWQEGETDFNKVFGIVRYYKDVTKDLVTFMSENPTLVRVHLPSSVSNYPSWPAYLDALGQDGTWGAHLAPIATANVYHMSIAIVSCVEAILIFNRAECWLDIGARIEMTLPDESWDM